jgi:hypothetical protein
LVMLIARLAAKKLSILLVAGALSAAQPPMAASQEPRNLPRTPAPVARGPVAPPVVQRPAPAPTPPAQPIYISPVQQPGRSQTPPAYQPNKPSQPPISNQTPPPRRPENPGGERVRPPTTVVKGNPDDPGRTRNPPPIKPEPVDPAPRPGQGNRPPPRQPPRYIPPIAAPVLGVPPLDAPPADPPSADTPAADVPASDLPPVSPAPASPPATDSPAAAMPAADTRATDTPSQPSTTTTTGGDAQVPTAPPPPSTRTGDTRAQPDRAVANPVTVRVWIPAREERNLSVRSVWFGSGLGLLLLVVLAAGWLVSKYRRRSLRSGTMARWHATPHIDPGAQWIASLSDPVGPTLGVHITHLEPVVELSWLKPKEKTDA